MKYRRSLPDGGITLVLVAIAVALLLISGLVRAQDRTYVTPEGYILTQPSPAVIQPRRPSITRGTIDGKDVYLKTRVIRSGKVTTGTVDGKYVYLKTPEKKDG